MIAYRIVRNARNARNYEHSRIYGIFRHYMSMRNSIFLSQFGSDDFLHITHLGNPNSWTLEASLKQNLPKIQQRIKLSSLSLSLSCLFAFRKLNSRIFLSLFSFSSSVRSKKKDPCLDICVDGKLTLRYLAESSCHSIVIWQKWSVFYRQNTRLKRVRSYFGRLW